MNITFKEAYKQYIKYAEIKQKKQSVEALKIRFKSRILPYFGDYELNYIDEKIYMEWQYKLLKENYNCNYLKTLHYTMVAFYDFCIIFLNIKNNVPKKVENFSNRNEKSKNDYYTLKEFKKFIKKVDNNIYKQFFNLMFYTGTRPGEAMALKFSDLEYKKISINKTIDEHGKREIGTPKTFDSNRIIQIDKKLYKDLLKIKKYYYNLYGINDNLFIFGGIKPLSPTTINRKKIIACEKAKVKVIRLHDFRHSHATLLLNKNINIKVISKRLGHSDVSTTLNTYIHIDLKQEKRVIKTLNFIRF